MQTVKGTRDIMPQDMLIRKAVLEKLSSIAALYGFMPIDTPALESWKVLSAKGVGGEDVIKEAYKFKDKGGRMIGLRYEFTVSLARLVASNPDMNLPFKRYQTGKVWRYDDVSKGRYREFSQFDIDIVGSDSVMADSENISWAIDCLKALGFDNFQIRVNSRKVITSMAKYAGIDEGKMVDVFRVIDKLEKIGEKDVTKQLEQVIPKQSAKKILDFIKISGSNDKVIEKVEKIIKCEGLEEMKRLLSYVNDKSKVRIDLSLARGLDYYTGLVYEISAGKEIGSVGGGGRYDKLIGIFLKKDVPACGISFGLDRLIDVIKEKKLIVPKSSLKVFVSAVNDKVRKDALKIVGLLRENDISVDYDLRSRKLSKQFEYASSMGIPYVIIVGPKELEKKSVTLRDMNSGKEEMVKIDDLAKKF
ncbi:MAG: histidine--tRNA ligase [Candidatus Aenigmarchaeota archaeon]|nr:histidine--tRNA ligase [Candidatus Aenigmarchaeota archaeon]